MLKDYYRLTKPGIIYGNAITALAGFFLAAKGHISWVLLIAMLIGLSLIIASACVFNNIYDADVDSKMDRTKTRAMVTGKIKKLPATVFGITLLIIGCLSFLLFTLNFSLLTALAGWLAYVLLYTPLKRRTVHATLIGAIAGATPPVVGYTAVTGRYDVGALMLFFILVFWQMPHFYSIAIYRIKDYAAADIPVLPIKNGIKDTKTQMLIYIVGFIIASASLTYFHVAGFVYLTVAMLLGVFWLARAIIGLKASDDRRWAKRMFLLSLIIISTLSATMALGSILP